MICGTRMHAERTQGTKSRLNKPLPATPRHAQKLNTYGLICTRAAIASILER